MDDFTKEIPQEPVENNDDLFPEFLWNPLFNDFEDDGFYQVVSNEYPFIEDVLRLKRKYRDFYKWQEAMKIYNDYMYFLETKYGSMSIINNSIEDGIPLDDYIPSPPKLKRNPTNKQIMKTGAIPTRRTVKEMDYDDTQYIIDQIYGDTPNKSIRCEFDEMNTKLSKESKRNQEIFNDVMDVAASKDRVNNVRMKKSARVTNGSDIIDEFYSRFNRNNYDSYARRVKEDEVSISEIVAHMDDDKYTNPYVLQYEQELLTSPIVYVAGNGVKRERAEQVEIMKYLLQAGYSIDGLSGSSTTNRKAIKMLKMQMGINDAPSTEEMQRMTKKERKKQMKKLKKQSKRAKINDDNIERVLFANRINHGDLGSGYRLNNLMSRDFDDD